MILNLSNLVEIDGFGVSCIRKGTKICTNEMGLFAVVTPKDEIQDRLDQAKIEEISLFNTVKEAIDAIYLNDLENDFQDSNDEEQEFEGGFSESESDDY
jgi:anti-anti-sigma regulatory factor